MKNKQAENINRLADFALSSFGIEDPLKVKEKMRKCPSCGRELPESNFESFECFDCTELRHELEKDEKDDEITKRDDDEISYLESNYFVN